MSNKAVGWAWEQATDLPIDKMVLVALADYAGKDGFSYPSHRELAQMAQCSVDTVQRAIKRLIARSLLAKERRWRENGGKSSNGYTVLFDGIQTPLPMPEPPLEEDAAASGDTSPPIPQIAASPIPQNAVCHTAPVRHTIPQLCGMQTSDLLLDPLLDPSPPTPSPPSAKRVGVKGDNPVQKLRTAGEHLHVVEGLIAPLWGALRFTGDDPEPWLASICAALGDLDPVVIDRTCDLIRNTRTVWPSAAQARKSAEQAALDVPLQRYAAGSIPYRSWLEHYRSTGRRFWAQQCEERGYVAERGPVPPSRKSQAA
jgi:hypothetical protein